jgi:hypothetical protein
MRVNILKEITKDIHKKQCFLKIFIFYKGSDVFRKKPGEMIKKGTPNRNSNKA